MGEVAATAAASSGSIEWARSAVEHLLLVEVDAHDRVDAVERPPQGEGLAAPVRAVLVGVAEPAELGDEPPDLLVLAAQRRQGVGVGERRLETRVDGAARRPPCAGAACRPGSRGPPGRAAAAPRTGRSRPSGPWRGGRRRRGSGGRGARGRSRSGLSSDASRCGGGTRPDRGRRGRDRPRADRPDAGSGDARVVIHGLIDAPPVRERRPGQALTSATIGSTSQKAARSVSQPASSVAARPLPSAAWAATRSRSSASRSAASGRAVSPSARAARAVARTLAALSRSGTRPSGS